MIDQFNLAIKSNNTAPMTVELFNSLNSFTHAWKPEYNILGVNTDYKPALTWNAPNGAIGTNLHSVAWTPDGSVIITRANGVLLATIEGLEYPYRSMIKALETRKFEILNVRMRSTTSAQLIEPVTFIQYTPLTAKFKETVYKITIDPMNVQPLLNDWKPKPTIIIDGTSGLKFQILPNEVLQWTVDYKLL